MILKYILLSFLCVIFITASDPFFGIELRLTPLPKKAPGDVIERQWMSTEAFRPYLMDKDNLVSDAFTVNRFFYPNVNFWFLIYTQFESSSVVIHDKNNLSLIYKVLDFSSLHQKELSPNILHVLQSKLSEEKLTELKNDLSHLVREPFSLSARSQKIFQALKQSGIILPAGKTSRIALFTKLRENIRSQTGQKNFIREGIRRSLPYQTFLSRYFREKRLPAELLSIPFLESSFNPRAHSKANALGIWQFMPLIASYYIPKRTMKTDYRYNVGISSIGAAFLMSENISIMKSWDLAVTAYNSGTRHLLATKRKLPGTVRLEDIIRHGKSERFGFASKNFYSEFLALAHALAYKDELFDDLSSPDHSRLEDPLRFYLVKCGLIPEKELENEVIEDITFHNHHLHNVKDVLPRGFVLTTKFSLPKKKFLEISYEKLLKIKPKDWNKLLNGQSCSTR